MLKLLFGTKLSIVSNFSWSMSWAIMAIIFWNYRNEHWGMWVFLVFAILISWKLLGSGIKLWLQMNHQAMLKLKSTETTDNFGKAGWASEEQIEAAGLFDPNEGIPIGAFNGRPLFYSPVHSLNVAPAGSGKTVSIALPARAHGFRVPTSQDRSGVASAVITDLKGELAAQTHRLSKELHGQKVYFLNPDGLFDLPSHRVNPLQHVIDDLAYAPYHRYAMSDAKEIALQLLPEPPDSDKNAFFRNGSRSILIILILWLAAEYAILCTLPDIWKMVSNPASLRERLEVAKECEALSGDIGHLAAGLLETPNDQFEDFRTGAIQAVEVFSPSGPLADAVSSTEFMFESLKHESAAVYIMARYDRKDAYAPWIGLIANMAIKALIRAGGNVPVHLLLDEATNFKLPSLANDLTALRGYGLRAHIICQAKSELTRVYGKQATETFYSQTDLKQFFGVASYFEADELSKMLGTYTIKTENLGAGKNPWDDLKDGISETSRPLMRPEEIMRMPASDQLIFIDKDGLPPIYCQRLPYNLVQPWADLIDDNPLEGGKLPANPKIQLNYKEV